MIFYVTIITGVLILYIFLKRKQKIPPGLKEIPIEKGLPIIGVATQVERPLCNYLVKLCQKHGPIYRVQIGMREVVVLSSFALIKATFVDNGDALSGRWKALKYVFVTKNSGLIFIDGNAWSSQRSFVLKTLKDFGMGRSRSMEIVQDECLCMLDDLENLEGKRVDFRNFVSLYTSNVILKLVMNKRFTEGDPLFENLKECLESFGNKIDTLSNFALMFPLLENNEWLMNFAIWVTSRKSFFVGYDKIFQKEIEYHLKRYQLNSEEDNLMDRFLRTQHQLRENNGDVESFTNNQLLRNASDLLAAGYDTTSSILSWGFMLMAMYPEVQTKVYEEITDKIGNERLPSTSDKVSLNYTQAVLDEIMRLGSVAPLAILHRTLNDVSVKGYFIPKDTVVIPNLFAFHLDRDVWENPLDFFPEHFLSKDNNGSLKYRTREELIPFGMGKRQCIGESLAKIENFVFFTSVIQRFRVSLVNESERKVSFDVFRSNEGIIRIPDVKDFIFTKRR